MRLTLGEGNRATNVIDKMAVGRGAYEQAFEMHKRLKLGPESFFVVITAYDAVGS